MTIKIFTSFASAKMKLLENPESNTAVKQKLHKCFRFKGSEKNIKFHDQFENSKL
jgi:hypothetical protein